MPSESSAARTRYRMKAELWSWTAWLVLAIISYPAVATARLSPWAGLTGGVATGAFLIARAGMGYAGRRDLDPWLRAALAAAIAATAASAMALAVDGSIPLVAMIAAITVAGQVLFTWYFLPAIVRDAETPEPSSGRHFQLLPWAGRGSSLIRPSLGMALLLGFLMLGAGAVWGRAEQWAPNPAPWFVAVALLSFGLMFVERLSFFERSAREGNLLMPVGSFSRWIGAAVLLLLVAGLLALIGPRRTAEDVKRARTAGGVAVPSAAALGGQQEGNAGAASASQSSASAARSRRQLMISLLLLLLLLALLVLIWFFSRSRAARWLLSVATAALTWLAARWRRFVARIRTWLRPDSEEQTVPQATSGDIEDPLRDPFEDPQLLRSLSARELLIRTYHLFLNFAEMLGYGRLAGQTPFEYARQIESERPQARAGLRALTWAYSGAMYGSADAVIPDPNAVRLAWRQIADALKGKMSPDDFDLRRRAYLAARSLEVMSRAR